MTASKALWLQNAALMIASREGDGLDLTKTERQTASMWRWPAGMVKPGDQVVIVGARTGDLIPQVVQTAGPTGRVRLIESDLTTIAKVQIASLEVEHTSLADLRTNPAFLKTSLAGQAIHDLATYRQFEAEVAAQRLTAPLVGDETVDLLIVDTAINRLDAGQASNLVSEAYRVLRRGGRLVVALLLADEKPTHLPTSADGMALPNFPLEAELVPLFAEVGFYGLQIAWRADLPYKVVEGVEFRAFVVEAFKGKEGVCLDQGDAVIYKGPWREVLDDDGHRYVRGERTALCAKTFAIVNRAPYQGQFIAVPSYLDIPLDQAPLFDCNTPQRRDPQVTKGVKTVFDGPSSACGTGDGGCCG